MKIIQLKNGDTVQLREAVKEDATELVAYLLKIGGESDFLTFGSGEFSVSVSDEQAMLEESRTAKNKIMLLALVGNKVIGCLYFEGGARPRIQHTGEFGVSVLKDYWDKGIGTEMVKELIQWAKVSNIIRKLNLRVRSDNDRAMSVYERLGFIQEGLITREFFISGEFNNFIYMGLSID
ncbi:acetyltransferase, ribosomal protein N-acetylase [Desulfitobacterium dichloroeliminans LMG P-21439]|uniref:Acetyltransferase, ribosomal protein N-acetylase n=1 Tax=Desulfitobacterium dichloroeliminans (strain LMG P-21439 / DCA1) TaxID=871963 RepID=L0F5J9_DESDL|nr:GNAT family protein [Desulfitobacterium dichloroeliminans]AGA68223.1 acetyltransferase, ribosomal protein N-acetylase [Desulfitobacterium dichloroeliminans LMG P-21439]